MATQTQNPNNPPLIRAALLETKDIIKEFPGVRALDGVSFDIRPGEIHALVGENGAGKSTLIKILAGVHPHGSFAGQILLDGQSVRFHSTRDSEAAGIGIIHQELALVKHMTVGENIFLGDEPARLGLLDWDRMYAKAHDLMVQLGLEIDVRTEMVNLGVGEQQLVEIAKALRKSNRILVLDEPTAALADHEVKILMGMMRELRARGTAMIYISHKLDEVFALADRITVLRDGKTIATREAADWSRDSVVHAMVGRDLTDMFPKVAHAPGKVLFEAEGICLEDPDVPGRMLLEDVSFQVREGEILGIAGLMGAGRTELLQTIFGAHPGRSAGAVRVEGRPVNIRTPRDAIDAGLALVPEDRKQHGLVLIFSVLENLSMVHLDEFCTAGVVDAHREFGKCQETARDLGVKAPSLHVPVQTLSGGNQQKVVLGKWLLRRPKVLFLDEPTRGIDVGAKAEIYQLMNRMTALGLGVVMVSSELPEILGVSDRIVVLREGRVSGQFTRAEATPEKIMEIAT